MSSASADKKQRHPAALLPEEWHALFTEWGERAFRAAQVFRWIHARGEFSPAGMSDLPQSLRERLAEAGLGAPAEVSHVHRAADGTRKLLLALRGGAQVECVLIPMTKSEQAETDADAGAAVEDEDEPEVVEEQPKRRITLCISTQYGCAMGCVFCASGQAGLQRGLTAEEIVAQVAIARRYLEADEHLRNLVFMGMGEPLHHYDETARAIRLLTHPQGAGMSPRRITVSTVGLVPGIRKLGEDFAGKVGLAVSLHAPDDATRSKIVPMNDRYSVGDILEALDAYPLPKRRRITMEYTLIEGVNDTDEHARALGRLLTRRRVKVNLIPMNGISASDLGPSAQNRVARFREIVAGMGLSCFVRTRRGDDVSAACGQLAMADDLVREKRSKA